jgi:hypothetical protein
MGENPEKTMIRLYWEQDTWEVKWESYSWEKS